MYRLTSIFKLKYNYCQRIDFTVYVCDNLQLVIDLGHSKHENFVICFVKNDGLKFEFEASWAAAKKILIESSFSFGILTIFRQKPGLFSFLWALVDFYLECVRRNSVFWPLCHFLSVSLKFRSLSNPKTLFQLFEEEIMFFHWINLMLLNAMYRGAIFPSQFCHFLFAEMSEILKKIA